MKAGELEIIPVLGMEPSSRKNAARRIAADHDAIVVSIHLGEGRPSDDVLREAVDGLLEAGAHRAVLEMGEEVLTTEVIGAFTQLPQAYIAAVVAVVDPDDAVRDLTGEDYLVRLHDDGVGSFQVPRAVLLTSQLEYATTLILSDDGRARCVRFSRTDVASFAMALGPSAQIVEWNGRDALPAPRPVQDLFRTTPGWLRVLNHGSSDGVGYRKRGGVRVPGSPGGGRSAGLTGSGQGEVTVAKGPSGSIRSPRAGQARSANRVGGVLPACAPMWAGSRTRAFHYRRERPFHPGRLLQCLEEGADWAPLLRVAGFTRIASRPGILSLWEQTGVTISVDPYEVDWWADRQTAAEYGIANAYEFAIGAQVGGDTDSLGYGPVERWRVDIGPLPDIGEAVLGQDIVAIGVDLDAVRLERELDACLLTNEEFLDGVWAWMTYEDAFPE
ncbi:MULTISPECIES: GTP-binding protein [unclassified Actinobaculum]|uniref:GTP-binding protein n=1 Tax=unclassified Actinobaculum TaxID=2609299 RepID=UPI000D526556|nr:MULTISPECIES: GTP-binding protein [unclassified Actinobaculum]AWE41549.1 hypothetical protein DDD63_00795 [Actinobaculum sp. 313]RTE48017.1 GTP-binding protein [Actinobaculum sp. 352]